MNNNMNNNNININNNNNNMNNNMNNNDMNNMMFGKNYCTYWLPARSNSRKYYQVFEFT